MKYDILQGFRQHLHRTEGNKNTADRYYFAVNKLLRSRQFNSLEEITPQWLEEQLAAVTTKNEFSAAKNGLKRLAAFDSTLQLPPDSFFKETSLRKRNRSKRPAKTLYLEQTNRTINGMRDPKLKLAYRLMLKSGLRVFEVAALEPEDIAIEGDVVTLRVRHGKGDQEGVVTCMSDPYLAEHMTAHLSSLEEGEAVFYSSVTMKMYALKRGLECHDLRRIAAMTYRKERLEIPGVDREQANADTQAFLRHERFSTTKRYLFNRKLKINFPIPKEPEEKELMD